MGQKSNFQIMHTHSISTMADNYRVAYLLLVHKNPAQVRRLIERLQSKEATFWIQVDIKSDISIFEKEFQGIHNVHFVGERRDGAWGSFSFLELTIEGIKWVAQHSTGYDHIVLLSGQDYPLCSERNIVNHLKEHKEASFIHYMEVTATCNPHVMERFSKYHIRIPMNKKIIYPYDSPNLNKKLINLLLQTTGKFPLPRVLPGARKLYFGSNWVRLSKKAVDFTIQTLHNEPEILSFFKYTTLSEEHLIQTLLLNADEAQTGPIINTNFTFCHWKRAPERYTIPLEMSDLDLILSSGDLLARKFDQDHDAEILHYLDQHSLHRPDL
jgi:hypothetical protein